MGHRSIVLLFSAFLTLAASNVFSLGLGKIKLESSLNQALQAEIELFEVRELTKEEIRVSVASREDFERIGVDKVYFLSDLDFDVRLNGPGSPKILVTSTKLVREPFLNFVVQVQWPSGKLLREYTLLLDLPAFSDQAAPVVQPGTSAPTTAVSRPSQPTSSDYNPRSAFQEAPSRPSSAPITPSYTGDSYRVESNDTLWEIAASVRPDRDVSIHQTMIAIQRVNPDAFINNNINLLKKGKVLRIPDRDEMAQLNRGQAVREVAEQNSQWSGDSGDVGGAELSTSSGYQTSDSVALAVEGRVKLASPDETYGSSEGRSSGGSADVSKEALENELASALEQVDKSDRENSELRSKIESLDEQVATLERMLEVANESLRAQELAARKAAEERAAALEADAAAMTNTSDEGEPIIDETLDADSTELSDVDALYPQDGTEEITTDSTGDDPGEFGADETVEGSIDEGALEEGLVEATPEPVPEATPLPDKKRVITPVAPEKSIIDMILDKILYIVLGVVALLVGAFFLFRQKSSDEDDFEDFLEEQGGDTVIAPVDTAPDTEDEDLDLGDFSEELESMDSDTDVDFEEELDTGVESEAETEDVVAEADIYIAYGKYDQAEEMLTRALAKEPNDEDIRLKLLEVYSSQGDGDSFDPQFAQLRSYAAPSVIERAEMLRSNIPNIGEFDEAAFAVAESAGIAQADDDTTQIQFPEGKPKEEDELSLDLDLDDAADSLASSGEDLDFDLDLPGDDDDTQIKTTDSSADEGADFDFDGLELDESDTSVDLDLESTAEDDELDIGDLGDFDLDIGEEQASDEDNKASLEADLASLEEDLDLSVDFDKPAVEEDTAIREPASLDDLDDLDDLELPEEGIDFDLEDGLDDLDSDTAGATSVTSDTTVNQALNDEYIEQKLSEEADLELDFDEALPLESEESSAEKAQDGGSAEEEGDLDLSSLDEELDALTAGLDDSTLASDVAPEMEEPVTDFDDFDDDLDTDSDAGIAKTAGDIGDMAEDSVFDQAISDTPEADDFELPDLDVDEAGDEDLDFLSDSDETATKLDLARAYIDMGDQEGARDIIKEVMSEGNDQQKSEAESLLSRLES